MSVFVNALPGCAIVYYTQYNKRYSQFYDTTGKYFCQARKKGTTVPKTVIPLFVKVEKRTEKCTPE